MIAERNVMTEIISIEMAAITTVSAKKITIVPFILIKMGIKEQIIVPICIKSIFKSSQ